MRKEKNLGKETTQFRSKSLALILKSKNKENTQDNQ